MCVCVSGLGVLRLEVFWLGVVVYGHPDPTLVVSLSAVPSARCPHQSPLISAEGPINVVKISVLRSSELASSEVVRGVDLSLSFGFLGDTAWDFSASQCLWWSLDSIGSVVSTSFEGLRAWTGG
ncbi:hypothetical protein Bca52824_072401 [Brassica carinata]|uniref:Secreted protein n=1 Tax=Brassica carinata TaxID=52824 RepID=A0A8X7U481_BRACI|nr:hypothetical protein Bca52824_072401 [Brassica carinata]